MEGNASFPGRKVKISSRFAYDRSRGKPDHARKASASVRPTKVTGQTLCMVWLNSSVRESGGKRMFVER